MYFDESNFNLILEQHLIRYSDQYPGGPQAQSPKIPVGNIKRDLPVYLFSVALLALTLVSLGLLNADWYKLVQRFPRLGEVFLEMSRFSTERFSLTVLSFTETVAVAVLALIYSLALGLALGALAAENISPWKPLSPVIKSFLAFIRAVPTPVWVLLVLASMGFGMASGIMGLSFHATAFFGMVFAQLFEEVPDEAIEAVRAAGANRLQVFFGAVLPSSLSGIIAWTSLRFETNYQEASILGMVGAGGIGYTIMAAMNSYKLGRAGLAVFIVFIFALGIELLTTCIKRRVKV
jgi:phosphonate transport system permease protein